ncbi:MAG: hypothetical protein R3F43_08975 [bacterium]
MSHLDLRQALEFAHYARLHRGTTFVAALGAGVAMADLLLDLKLLAAYGLPGVVVVPRPDAELAEAARLEGLPIVRVEASRPGSLRSALAMGQVPVVPVDPADGDEGLEVEVVATRLAVELAARRLLLIRSTHPALSDELEDGPPGPATRCSSAVTSRGWRALSGAMWPICWRLACPGSSCSPAARAASSRSSSPTTGRGPRRRWHRRARPRGHPGGRGRSAPSAEGGDGAGAW